MVNQSIIEKKLIILILCIIKKLKFLQKTNIMYIITSRTNATIGQTKPDKQNLKGWNLTQHVKHTQI